MRISLRAGFLSLAFIIASLGGCSDKDSGNGPVDPLALWKSQPEKIIVFMSRADSPEGELYYYNKAGQEVRLTNNSRHENNPALSYDGTKVAFHAGNEADPTTWEIYTIDIATKQETRLTNNSVADGHPDWSPDGNMLVFASFRDSLDNPATDADLYFINSDGTGERRAISSDWDDNDPEWSPDGTRIAFKSNRHTQIAGRPEIYIADTNGANVVRLTTTTGWESDHDPSWSPNSQSIVFSRFEGTRPWYDLTNLDTLLVHWQELTPWNIYSVTLGGTLNKLTDEQDIAEYCVYSDDGTRVLYCDHDFVFVNGSLTGLTHRLRLIPAAGGDGPQLLPDDRHLYTLEYLDW